MRHSKHTLKLLLGFAVSISFLFLAFRQLDLQQMKHAFSVANYWLLIPSLVVAFVGHWLRSLRWQILLRPIQAVPVSSLFSALLIGYSANNILPAHLGEFLRAYVIGRKHAVRVSSVFATIVVERVIDILSLVFVFGLTFVVYPFPDWVRKSGYLMFAFGGSLFAVLILMKRHDKVTLRCMVALLRPLPETTAVRIQNFSRSFLEGLRPMESTFDYVTISMLSILIWFCYWALLYFNFFTFNLVTDYSLGVAAGLVVLVIATISIVVPSSPGYVGTYHYLCQISLELFGVPRALGLSYGIMVHALAFVPVSLVGLPLAWREGIQLSKARGSLAMGMSNNGSSTPQAPAPSLDQH